MTGIITKDLVYRYLVDHPYSTPPKIAKDLDASVSTVNKRLLKLLYNRVIDRKEDKPKLDHMYYFPVNHENRSQGFAY